MTTRIALISFDKKTGRTTISLDVGAGDNQHTLWVDGKKQQGRFVATGFGWLYKHSDGTAPFEWGWPGASYGPHEVTIQYRTRAENIGGDFGVGKPPSTLGSVKLAPVEILPHLWNAGFRSEHDLLLALSIAAGESGGWIAARNWLPQDGFRPATDVIGVQGPAAAWNRDHSQQGHSDRGLFQMNAHWFAHIPDAACDDPALASKALFDHVQKQGWGSWGQGNPDDWYKPFYDGTKNGIGPLRPIVVAFIASKP